MASSSSSSSSSSSPPPSSSSRTRRSHDKMTFNVQNVSEIPGYDASNTNAAVEIWAIDRAGEKARLRSVNISHLEKMRDANFTPASVTDVAFLTQGMLGMFNKLGFTHCELAIVSQMSPKKQKGQHVEFPADAFGQEGTTRALNK